MKTVFTYGGANPYNPSAPAMITVEQSEDKDALFKVTYGVETNSGLTYARACGVIGQVILHHLSCESIVNNEGK